MNNKKFDNLYNCILKSKVLERKDTDSLIHALSDIFESTEKIYKEIVPKIADCTEKEKIQDLLWEIREEFRHVKYHIDDAHLTEL